ncbi:hypothetical protein [Peribacillus simplex]|uniref:hypothetical protein n=1 Tax=Peribacillus simplex TaxID=1478 RepID=UPI003D2BCAD3
MSLIGISGSMGTTQSNLVNLIRKGRVSPSISGTLNTTASSVEDFINGRASVGIASVLGTTTSTAQDLRNEIGREGAIGLIIGLCINNK